MQPRLDLPPLKYQHNLSKHEDFVLAAEYQLISHAVNICAMIESSDREVVVQAGLAHAVKGCLEKAHNIGPNSAETMKKEVQGNSDLEGGQRIDVGQQISVNGGRRRMRDRCTCSSPCHSNS